MHFVEVEPFFNPNDALIEIVKSVALLRHRWGHKTWYAFALLRCCNQLLVCFSRHWSCGRAGGPEFPSIPTASGTTRLRFRIRRTRRIRSSTASIQKPGSAIAAPSMPVTSQAVRGRSARSVRLPSSRLGSPCGPHRRRWAVSYSCCHAAARHGQGLHFAGRLECQRRAGRDHQVPSEPLWGARAGHPRCEWPCRHGTACARLAARDPGLQCGGCRELGRRSGEGRCRECARQGHRRRDQNRKHRRWPGPHATRGRPAPRLQPPRLLLSPSLLRRSRRSSPRSLRPQRSSPLRRRPRPPRRQQWRPPPCQ